MTISKRRRVTIAVSLVAAGALVATATAPAGANDRLAWGSVAANAQAAGGTTPNALSPQLGEHAVAQGSMRLENPSGDVTYYGYHSDGPLVPAPGAVQSPGHNVEASKTEPDKNTYLRLTGQHGAD